MTFSHRSENGIVSFLEKLKCNFCSFLFIYLHSHQFLNLFERIFFCFLFRLLISFSFDIKISGSSDNEWWNSYKMHSQFIIDNFGIHFNNLAFGCFVLHEIKHTNTTRTKRTNTTEKSAIKITIYFSWNRKNNKLSRFRAFWNTGKSNFIFQRRHKFIFGNIFKFQLGSKI